MAAPAYTNTQALAPGDLKYMTDHAGDQQVESRDSAKARAEEQFSQAPYDSRFNPSEGAADTAALDAVVAALLAGAGAHTGTSLAGTLTAVNNAVKGVRDATDSSTFTYAP